MDCSCDLNDSSVFDTSDMELECYSLMDCAADHSVSTYVPRETHDENSGFRTGSHKDPFDNVPEEILHNIFQFLDPPALLTAADVCKRFRDAVGQKVKSFELDMCPCSKREEYAGRLIVRLHNLRSLDLSAPSCRSFLTSNTQITGFATSLAASCRKIESFTLLGVRGARVLRVYVHSLGEAAKVKHLSLDIQRAAIGCATSLQHVSRHVNLTSLTLSSNLSIRRCSRTRDVLSQLFAQLLPGITCLILQFVETDMDITSLAVSHTSGLRYFAADNITDQSLATLAQQNPDIESLKIAASSESLKQLFRFPNLHKLWIHIPADEDIEAEDVEEAFGAEPLKSQLRMLAVRGCLSSDPLRGISLLSHLEVLVVDRCGQLLYEKSDHKYKRMLRLKHMVILTSFRTSFAAPPPPAPAQRSSGEVLKLFPSLGTIRFTDCEFNIKDNFSFRRVITPAQDIESLFTLSATS